MTEILRITSSTEELTYHTIPYPKRLPQAQTQTAQCLAVRSRSRCRLLLIQKYNPACGEGRSEHSLKHGRRATANVNKFAASNTAQGGSGAPLAIRLERTAAEHACCVASRET
eukprot:367893-Pleurochrysis_carterae.AAC.4